MEPLLLEPGELAPLGDVMRTRTLDMTNSIDTIPLGAALCGDVGACQCRRSRRLKTLHLKYGLSGRGVTKVGRSKLGETELARRNAIALMSRRGTDIGSKIFRRLSRRLNSRSAIGRCSTR